MTRSASQLRQRACCDGSDGLPTRLSPEDQIALQILGWRPEDDVFVRSWHGATPSTAIADDVVRTATHGFRCESFELQLDLREPVSSHARR